MREPPLTQSKVWLSPRAAIGAILAIAAFCVFLLPRTGIVVQFVNYMTVIAAIAAIAFGLTFYPRAFSTFDRFNVRRASVRRIAGAISFIGFSFLLVHEVSLSILSTNSGMTPSPVASAVQSGMQASDRPASTRCPQVSTGWSGKPVSLFEYWDPGFWVVHRVEVTRSVGMFVHNQTDLCIKDSIPIVLTRSYRGDDKSSQSFGIGFSSWFDIFISGSTQPFSYMFLALPNGTSLYYHRISPGVGYTDAVYIHDPFPGEPLNFLTYSKIVWNHDHWELSTKGGLKFIFPDSYHARRQGQAAFTSISDEHGDTLNIVRDADGNVLQVKSPRGYQISMEYDSGSRIKRVVDTWGDRVNYTYDPAGRLESVNDGTGTTQYRYDSHGNMAAIIRPDEVVWDRNEFDGANRIVKEQLPDAGETRFRYTTDKRGNVTGSEQLTSDGCRESSTYNSLHQAVSDARVFTGTGTAPDYCE
jgi:YD repeat-containing protein